MDRKTILIIAGVIVVIALGVTTLALLSRRGSIGPISLPSVITQDDADEGSMLEEEVEAIIVDKDRDGLTDEEERGLGTDPDNHDSDGDGYFDGDEVNYLKTDPLTPNKIDRP